MSSEPIAQPRFAALTRLFNAPTLARSLALLLGVAILLLLAANAATYMMIKRTQDYNARAEASQKVRRSSRSVLISLLDAETGQRGFLLTGDDRYLNPYLRAKANIADEIDALSLLAGDDPEAGPHVARLIEAARDKMTELQRTVDLNRTGRFEEAVSLVRSDRGRVDMDQVRSAVGAIETIEQERLTYRQAESERGAVITVWTNAFGGLLILVLAGISGLLVRRYIGDLRSARDVLDEVNAGLEETVAERTADLRRANEEVQRFAYIVSHDLRAPLVNVMGYTAELEQAGRVVEAAIRKAETEREVDPGVVAAVREDMPEAIGFIRSSTEKMDRLINAILRLSREGRRTLTPEILDMTAMAQGIADSINHQTEAQGARIDVEPLPRLESDRLSMEQILGNLIDNAVKYLDPARPGVITVSGETAGDGWVTYRVADTGRGIAEKDHERIFELFRRSGRQDRPGEGLGLAFVRNSVRRLGGDIEVESILGEGSTFVLKFPTRLSLSEPGEAE